MIPVRRVHVALVALLAAPVAVTAQDLRIGLSVAPTSIDPHFHNNAENTAFARHVFDALVIPDAQLQPRPGLAASWHATDSLEWTFKLRAGVRFHDGSPFTADDVLFSFERAPNVPNSPSSFALYLKDIASVSAPDPQTLVIRTHRPAPLLPTELASIAIVSRRHGATATTPDYASGRAMIGTGPFRYISGRTGEKHQLSRNDDYWGQPPHWRQVAARIIANPPSRVAALLAGDVDLIANVPPNDVARLARDGRFRLWRTGSNRIVFVSLDVGNERPLAGFATDTAGRPLERNPMLDARVRKALSLALNRQAIVDQVLEGEGVATNQIVPHGFLGHVASLPPEPHDPATARRLLAEAGYPAGLSIVLHASTDRIPSAAKVVQAVGQMWARIGVVTRVELMPHQTYITRANRGEFAHMLHSWGNSTGEAYFSLAGIAMTRDLAAGTGTSNRGRYSNPEVDRLAEEAARTVDRDRRRTLLERAIAIVAEDRAILPLYLQTNTWATTAAVVYEPQVNQATMATAARPAVR